ncbi:MAG: S41 family peptidase, partial [Bacteroidales bacterium]|nr:S41 family peptidase [Bacteroidales bacterium]
MRRWVVFALAAMLATGCGDANQQYVRKAVSLMDRHGLFAEGPDWEAARQAALKAEPASLEEAHETVRTALKVAGGKHSFLYQADDVKEDAGAEWEDPTVRLEDGIAIISLPAFSGNAEEGKEYAQAVLDAVPETVTGAVIDLRGNTGGNMYPMIASVHRFLPDGNDLLRFRTRKRTQWIPLSSVIQISGVQAATPVDCPVALLTDGRTASSGEATLLCFRGLEKARVFGSPTAGYASANQPFPMPDGSQLVLTTGCDVARTGEAFCD